MTSSRQQRRNKSIGENFCLVNGFLSLDGFAQNVINNFREKFLVSVSGFNHHLSTIIWRTHTTIIINPDKWNKKSKLLQCLHPELLFDKHRGTLTKENYRFPGGECCAWVNNIKHRVNKSFNFQPNNCFFTGTHFHPENIALDGASIGM